MYKVRKMKFIRILNVNILPVTQNRLLCELEEGVLYTPNLDHLIKLQYDREFYDIYQQAEWIVCDSQILYLASKLLKRSLPMAIPEAVSLRHSIIIMPIILIVKFFC